MAMWKNKIDVSKEWAAAQGDPQGFRAVARSAAMQLRRVRPSDLDLEAIREDLASIAGDSECTANDFDEIWEALYDWGDAGQRLWVQR